MWLITTLGDINLHGYQDANSPMRTAAERFTLSLKSSLIPLSTSTHTHSHPRPHAYTSSTPIPSYTYPYTLTHPHTNTNIHTHTLTSTPSCIHKRRDSERAFTRLRAAEADISCDDAAFPLASRLSTQVGLRRSARLAEA